MLGLFETVKKVEKVNPALTKELRRLKDLLAVAENQFNHAITETEIDIAVYDMQKAEIQIKNLITTERKKVKGDTEWEEFKWLKVGTKKGR